MENMSQTHHPKLKFFLDENMPLIMKEILISLGHEVEHARMKMQGCPDEEIVLYAKENNAILVTKDLGLGNVLIYPKSSHYGLIIIRTPLHFTAPQITELLKNFIDSINLQELINSIVILELGRYRIRKL